MRQGGLNIVEILRAQHINRWTIVPTTRPQSLAEHTFNVTMLVRDYCRRVDWDDDVLMKAALEHDLDEILTGDIPTPAKEAMRSQGFDPDKLNGKTKNVDMLDGPEKDALKCIDILESVHFLDNYGAGKRANWVQGLLMNSLEMKVDRLGEWGDHFAEAMLDLIREVMESVHG